MNNLHLTSSAMLLIFTISSSVFATDIDSLPSEERKGRQAVSQCLEGLQAFDQKLAEVGFGVLPPRGYGIATPSSYSGTSSYGMTGTPRQKIYSLREMEVLGVEPGRHMLELARFLNQGAKALQAGFKKVKTDPSGAEGSVPVGGQDSTLR